MKNLICKNVLMITLALLHTALFAQNSKRWSFDPDGGISWNIQKGPSHTDQIEMSGLQVSGIVRYGTDDNGQLVLKKKLVFPMLRTIPNNTHASLSAEYNDCSLLTVSVNGSNLQEFPRSFRLKGILYIACTTNTPIETNHSVFPSADKAALVEMIRMKNTGHSPCQVRITNNYAEIRTDPAKGVYGQYLISAQLIAGGRQTGTVEKVIGPQEVFEIAVVYSGRKNCEEAYAWSPEFELHKRQKLVGELMENLVLDTPNDTIDREFAFAKIRTAESIYDTKGGLMHGPGGGAYYAAIWANDQAEYANPFFPLLGNLNGNESAINSFRHFARFMNPDYKPIPSSIIAEGTDIWNGAGDRGDMAMIAYGASRYALATGNPEIAKELYPLISWCMEYLERKRTPAGVIASDNDELEGRFPAGKVNLSTNSLTYGAYISAAHVAGELGHKDVAETCRIKAAELRKAIEKYFGTNVQGFDTYRYYEDNTKLRSWICLPLVMGITERKEETIKALFSDYLWTSNGILTESGSKTFWDRSTLYAFRGLLATGATDECMKYLAYYSATRLLGEHVPYPIEAWPEGDQRHLSAESALYCRVITEGLFGIRPTGLNRFTVAPWLPKDWDHMSLRNIKAFDQTFDIEVKRMKSDEMITVKTASGETIEHKWDRKEPLSIVLP
ncbi:MAG: hypothetical protein AB2L24_23000 [Mangrovibacterium sp.]